MSTTVQRRISRSVGWAALVGVAGHALNHWPLELVPGVDVLLGPFLVLPTAVLLGPCAGALAGFLSGAATLMQWGHPWGWIGSVLEGLVLGALARRLMPLGADALYWLFGAPFLVVALRLGLQLHWSDTLPIVAKHAVNSLVPVLITQVALVTPWVRRRIERALPRPPRTFRLSEAVGSGVVLAVVLPLLVVGVSEGRARYHLEEEQLDELNVVGARISADALARSVEAALSQTAMLAEELERAIEVEGALPAPAALQEELERTVRHSVGTHSGHVGGAEGRLLARWPPQGHPPGSDFSGWDFFQAVREEVRPFVSSLGRGAGAPLQGLVLVAPVAPRERFAGYVLLTLDVEVLRQLVAARLLPEQRVHVLDAQGRVLLGSHAPPPGGPDASVVGTPLGEALAHLDGHQTGDYSTEPGASSTLRRALATWCFALAPVNGTPWRVVVERPLSSMEQSLMQSYRALVFSLALALVLALAGARFLERLVVPPMEGVASAAQRLAHGEREVRTHEVARDATLELQRLAGAFDTMAEQLVHQLEAIERSARAKDEFLSVASHELKTPLATLKMQCQLLQRQLPDVRCGRLVALDRQVDRITRLVNQMLDVSELESGALQLERQRMDLGALVEQVGRGRAAGAPRHTLQLALEPLEGLWDRRRLGQVVYNIVDNAIRFSPEGGPVEVFLRQELGQAVLRVADRGVGLEDRTPEALFGRFAAPIRQRMVSRVAGLGVGLYLAREIVGLHGGSIQLEPRAGGGTLVTVRLPLVPEAGPLLQRPGSEEARAPH